MNTDLAGMATTNPPTFHRDKLCLFDDWKTEKIFLKEESYMEKVDVDVAKVIGHSQGYGEMTWGYMLNNLKRIDARLEELANNPDYYLEDSEKQHWSFIEVDGQMFISSGKHRTTVLRYLAHYNAEEFPNGAIARKVSVIKKKIDRPTMRFIGSIKTQIEKHPHLEFSYQGRHLEEHRWLLRNQKQDSRWLILKEQLSELDNDLTSTTPLKRIYGKGYQACIRKSIWTGFGPTRK